MEHGKNMERRVVLGVLESPLSLLLSPKVLQKLELLIKITMPPFIVIPPRRVQLGVP